MNFKHVTDQLIKAFEDYNINYALIGGFAIGLWGSGRSTLDMDFLVEHDDISKIEVIMKNLGYECRHKSENVSQYLSPLKIMGEVDFLHAFREASISMLSRTVEKTVFNGAFKIRVLQPTDLIGLKVQAMTNDPEREPVDMSDIESLLKLHKDTVDWKMIGEYFILFNKESVFTHLKDKYQ